jgi:ribosomal protein S18 acetylase RimI-like enzyme
METVQGDAQGWNEAAQSFVKTLAFKQVRLFSTMETDLAAIPHGVGESDTARLELIGRTEENARLLVGLENDSFKEHFNHRDGTVAEVAEAMFWFKCMKDLEIESDICIAWVEEEPVGFLVYGIDHKDNRCLKKERGWLFSLGVLKPFRGQGVAKALMIYGMRELKARGMKQAGLGVDNTNVTKAMRLYERLGFKTTRKYLTYERNLV